MKFFGKIFLSLILIPFVEFSCYGQNEDTLSEKQRSKLEDNEIKMRTHAEVSYAIKRCDTLGADSVILQFFPNGQLYSQKPYKDGTINGTWYKYNSNGTLNSQDSYKDGVLQNDYRVEYDIFGFVRFVYLDIICNKKKYTYSFTSYYGRPRWLDVYTVTLTNRFKTVAEYKFDAKENKWRYHYYHSRPSKLTSYIVLRRYLKKDKQYHLTEIMQNTRIIKDVDYQTQKWNF